MRFVRIQTNSYRWVYIALPRTLFIRTLRIDVCIYHLIYLWLLFNFIN